MNPPPPPAVPFEQSLAELEALLRTLEDGTTGLEESLAAYERGVGLLKHCYAQLRQAEQRIQQLTGTDDQDRPVLRPFDHSSATDAVAPPPARRRKPPPSPSSDTMY